MSNGLAVCLALLVLLSLFVWLGTLVCRLYEVERKLARNANRDNEED